LVFYGGYLDKKLSKDSKITIILLVIGFTVGYETILFIYRNIALSAYIEIQIFLKKLFIEIIYNTLLTIIIYPLLQKLGYKMEDIFKNYQILTRYF